MENGRIDGIFRISGEKARINALRSPVTKVIDEGLEGQPISPSCVRDLESILSGEERLNVGNKGGEEIQQPKPQQCVIFVCMVCVCIFENMNGTWFHHF